MFNHKYSIDMKQVIGIETVNHPLFGEIERATTEDGKIWYKGKDVALALGYKSPHVAIKYLNDTLKIEKEYRTGLGYIAHRSYSYIGQEAIKTLLVKRLTLDVKKRVKECISQIDLV